MAAAATTIKRRTREEATNIDVCKEPISFHLALLLGNEYFLPEGKNSVDVLRMPFCVSVSSESSSKPPESSLRFFNINSQLFTNKIQNITGTRMEFWVKKFNSSQSTSDLDKAWQDRLIIVTEKRLFIVTKKQIPPKKDDTIIQAHPHGSESEYEYRPSTDDLEIVDSIPMEEIISFSLESEPSNLEDNEHAGSDSFISKSLRRTATLLGGMRDRSRRDDSGETTEDDRRSEQRNLWQSIMSGRCEQSSRLLTLTPDDFRNPVLHITTKQSGFNRGHSYFFLLCQQDHPCIDGDVASHGTAPLCTPAHAEVLTARLSALVVRRCKEHARETWFHRLQQRLCQAWDSFAFNLAVLVLILSNFAFTVVQVPPLFRPARQCA
jgi:hypothetical protein